MQIENGANGGKVKAVEHTSRIFLGEDNLFWTKCFAYFVQEIHARENSSVIRRLSYALIAQQKEI